MTIPVERVKGKIYLLRGQKVLFDADLAEHAVHGVDVSGADRHLRDVAAEVTWLADVTGRNDFQVNVACEGTAGLNQLLKRFTREFGADDTVTTVVLERSR